LLTTRALRYALVITVFCVPALPMKFFGIALRRPHFNELTAAAVMAAGLWLLAMGASHALALSLDRADAGAMLLMISWGCLSVRFGLRMDLGQRHLVANLAGATVLLGLYQAALTLAA
jgi:hypothetical protein